MHGNEKMDCVYYTAKKLTSSGPSKVFSVIIEDKKDLDRWQSDRSTPLIDVVQNFNIYITVQGTEGIKGLAGKTDLRSEFDTDDENDIIRKILEGGEFQPKDAPGPGGTKNSH